MNHFTNIATKSFELGGKTVTLETGKIARQATSAVMATMGRTTVLCTVVASKHPTKLNYFPLTVLYAEKTYAAGKIPGGFFKREGRPSTGETLISRLIDRPIRPLFDNRFNREIQIVNQVLSLEEGTQADILSLIATSAALAISGLPFNGPIGAAKVGYDAAIGYVLNPNLAQLQESPLNMVVAGTASAVLMVESEAKELSEDLMLGAVLFAHQEMQVIISSIQEFATEVKPTPVDWQPEDDAPLQLLQQQLTTQYGGALESAYQTKEKQIRSQAVDAVYQQAEAAALEADEAANVGLVKDALKKIEKNTVRQRILAGQPRIDGRNLDSVRPIAVELGLLPSTHGSALFTRGETQALVVATLSQPANAQIIDSLSGTVRDKFMLHYNFPPFCTGETGMMGSPKRREIGHGNLAKSAIKAVLPAEQDFPYALRVVSEITESNGSSSMASVCGSSLALMDAGIPISAAVAGIAMGLVKEGDAFAVLTDILGDEDHLGDMDFKVAGTAKGITALQMDIKIEGINETIMEQALAKACQARMHILGIMNAAIEQPRTEMAEHAPRIHRLKVKVDKIRDIIGKGGATIQGIIKETETEINIGDDGEISVFATKQDNADRAIAIINKLTEEVEVDRIYPGVVKKIVEFGAFVNILPGKDGLVHVSQIAEERVSDVNEYFTEEQKINVRVIGVDRAGKIKLQYKDVPQDEQPQ